MKVIKIKNISINFFLNKKLFPKNFSLEKFKFIIDNFKVKKKIVCMPDLNFKAKNFIPTGVNVPIIDSINPLLLSSNINDSIGAIKVRTEREIKKKDIKIIFNFLRKNISIFRRKKNIINKKEFTDFLENGVKNIYKKWNFTNQDINCIENKGKRKLNINTKTIIEIVSKKKIKSLPNYIPNDGFTSRGLKNIGVLDGTSHFIELFRVMDLKKKKDCKNLDVKINDYFFLVHAGSGDVGRYIHHYIQDKNINNIKPNSFLGKLVKSCYMAAINYGFVNRLFIYKKIIEAFKSNNIKLNYNIFSDLPHDYLECDLRSKNYYHRKGVIKVNPKSKFTKSHRWSKTGSPYILPSHPGGNAYIMINKNGNKNSLYSLNHGMGRSLSKTEAAIKIKKFSFNKKKIQIFRYYKDDLRTQSPKAFKDTKNILNAIKSNKLADNIAVLESVAVLKA